MRPKTRLASWPRQRKRKRKVTQKSLAAEHAISCFPIRVEVKEAASEKVDEVKDKAGELAAAATDKVEGTASFVTHFRHALMRFSLQKSNKTLHRKVWRGSSTVLAIGRSVLAEEVKDKASEKIEEAKAKGEGRHTLCPARSFLTVFLSMSRSETRRTRER